MTTITMSVLYQKLKKLNPGFTHQYIREQGLPSWWDDALNDKPLATLEGAGHIAKRLNIDLLSLLEEEIPRFKPLPHTKFKYHRQGASDTPNAAHQIASSIAVTVAHATALEYQLIPADPQQIRRTILEKHPQVTLYSLLHYCWEHGIAVVYFNRYPKKTRKITGMIQWQENQPVIVLSGGKIHPACLAFDLAHELGHLALGHVQKEDKILIDDAIEANTKDVEEAESNRFAVTLLLDNLDNHISHKSFKDTQAFTNYLKQLSHQYPTVDLGAIAFNYAWHRSNPKQNYFPLAMGAVKILSGESCGRSAIQKFLENHLDWPNLSEDMSDRLEIILGE